MSTPKPKAGWLAKRRDKQRDKRARTGDSAEKQEGRHKQPGTPTVKDAAGSTGFIANGGL